MINIPPPVRAPCAEPAGSRPSELLQQDGRAQAGRQAGRAQSCRRLAHPKAGLPSQSSIGPDQTRQACDGAQKEQLRHRILRRLRRESGSGEPRAHASSPALHSLGSRERLPGSCGERNEKHSRTDPILACAARRRKVLPKSKSAGLVPVRAPRDVRAAALGGKRRARLPVFGKTPRLAGSAQGRRWGERARSQPLRPSGEARRRPS